MQVTNPMWLWALTGLIVPVAIHLLSRKEGRIIEMGSIRFLRESATAKFRWLRLNEIPLLAIRCLVVIVFALLLAGLKVDWFSGARKWVVLEDGVGESEKLRPVLEKLRQQGYEVRTMAAGFPFYPGAATPDYFDDYGAMLQQLSSAPVDSAVVISYNYQRKFKGPRLAIPPHIRWVAQEVGEKEFTVGKFRTTNDSLWTRRGYTSANLTYFQTTIDATDVKSDSAEIRQPEEINITIATALGFEADQKILTASLEAIRTTTPHILRITNIKTSDWNSSSTDFLFWLAPHPPKAPVSGTTIALRDCEHEGLPLLLPSHKAVLYCGSSSTGGWLITKRLAVALALKENITLQLAELILPKATNDHPDFREIPEPLMWSSYHDGSPSTAGRNMRSADDLLMVLLLLALTGERILAYMRKQ